MEIQKIFSEIETGEKLYSVLMTEDELALFSDPADEESTAQKVDRVSKKVAKIGAVTAGAGLASTVAGGALMGHGSVAAAKAVQKGGMAGTKRIATGALAAGLGGKAMRYGGLAALGSGAVYGINKLANGDKLKKKK